MKPIFSKKTLAPDSYSKALVGLEQESKQIKVFSDFVWSEDWASHSKTLKFMPTLLLFGPPGTGKTTLLRNLANDTKSQDTEYFKENLDLFADRDLGETSKAIERLFTTIKERATCEKKVLLHLDDADSLLSSRSQNNESSGVKRAVNTFITQLDDMTLENFKFPPIIAATTNIINNLDPAIKRRFSLKIKIDPKLNEAQVIALTLPLIELCKLHFTPDYSELTTVIQSKNLTPNDVIRTLQDLYLLSRGGANLSNSDFLNAFNKSTSSRNGDMPEPA